MPISIKGAGTDKDVFYTERYKTMVRSERELLLRKTTDFPIVSRSELYAYRHDFYRLLRVLNVLPHLHWTIAYLNGIEDPSMDCSHLSSIRMIDEDVLAQSITRSNTQRA